MQRPSSGRRHGAALAEEKEKPAAWVAGLRIGGGAGDRYRFRRFALLAVLGCGIFFH